MESTEKLKKINDGSMFPQNYDETYLATKHISKIKLEVPLNIINIIEEKLQDENIFVYDKSIIYQIVIGLIKGNIILQGPPGTGKTTIAKVICESFNIESDIVTATSDWTTYDTIGGFQPEIDDDGNEVIVGKNGRIIDSVINCSNKILQKKIDSDYAGNQGTWLIIDELNRSEIDKVFGDLFTVFSGSDSNDKSINLWFHKNKNKKKIFIPQKFRIIGVINNIDKNFIFNLSQGLSRRFTFIDINPPSKTNFDKEIKFIKTKKIKDRLLEKISGDLSNIITHEKIETIYEDEIFKNSEKILIKLCKRIRYDSDEENNEWLGLNIGTAQIIDLYETILLNLLLNRYLTKDSDEKKEFVIETIDRSVRSRIVPQMDGHFYNRVKNFLEYLESDDELKTFENTIRHISKYIL